MGMKIGISFKENEQYIFKHISKQLSASIYIKQLVLADIKKNEPSQLNNKNC